MLFFFKHIAGVIALPPTINFLLIILGGILLKFFRIVGKILIVLSVLSLWIFSTPIVARHLLASLQNQYPPLSVAQLHPMSHTAIVVLEAGLKMKTPEYGNVPMVSTGTLIRLRYAAFLYHKTHAPILVSGNDPYHPTVQQTTYMANALRTDFHVPTTWRESRGYDTAQEAVNSIRILKKAGIKKIYLVTQAFHMPRSMIAFTGKGMHIIPAPMDYQAFSYGSDVLLLLPSSDALMGSYIALHEYLGMVLYWWYSFFNI